MIVCLNNVSCSKQFPEEIFLLIEKESKYDLSYSLKNRNFAEIPISQNVITRFRAVYSFFLYYRWL